MKILHIIFSMQLGGSETMLVDILNEQVKFPDSQVGLFIVNNNYNVSLINKIDSRVEIIFNNRKEKSKSLIDLLLLNLKVRKFKPDFVHIHDQNIVKYLFVHKHKKILTIHDVGLYNKCWNNCNILCAISKAVSDDISKSGKLDSRLIYNGINFDRIKKKEKYFDPAKDVDFKIIQVSRLEHSKKGQDIVIKALSLLKREYKFNIHLDFIGQGSSSTYLKELAQQYGLSDNIHFLGSKDRDYIYDHLCDYDLLLQPSNFEGFGLTIVEGIAAKLPILVSDIDGPMEIVTKVKYGFHFERGNVEDCARKIKEIIFQIDLKKNISESYNYAKEYFSINKTAANYWKLYGELKQSQNVG